MLNKKIRIVLFVLVALVQLYIPAKMVWGEESLIKDGTEYKFLTAPVDPNDPFRGKYITLAFANNTHKNMNGQDFKRGDQVYVLLSEDEEGFAKIEEVSKEVPDSNQDYVKAKLHSVRGDLLSIDYPFDRYYMEESKAYDAELLYRKVRRDTTKKAYALVNVSKGEFTLKDVLIDGSSIKDLVEEMQGKVDTIVE